MDYKLVGSVFAGSLGRRTISEDDGLEIVRSVFDDGGLRKFAEIVQGWKDFSAGGRTLAYDESNSYPQDVFALAEVFLKWHNVLLDLPILKGPKQPPNSAAQVA